MRSVYVYPKGALVGDGLTAGCGMTLTGGPLLLLDTAPVVTGFLIFLLIAFAIFGWRVAGQVRARIRVTEDGISASALGTTALAWREVESVKLSYYSTKRDKTSGWLQLVLLGRRQRLSVDSRIEGFAVLAAHAARAVRANGLRPDPTTIENFHDLGLELGADR